jgi:hypothetical protein
MFRHPGQIAASFGNKVNVTSLSGWRTTMKMSILVSVGTTIGLLAATAALASTVTTEHGRPLLVEAKTSVAACSDVVLAGTDAESWHDALADKRAHDRVVQASWNNALANKRAQDRASVVASAGSAAGCVLTN